jgi:CHAD domain-containing protein
MPVDQKYCEDVFRTLGRELAKVTKHSSPERVHKFRTSTRRVETVLEDLVPQPNHGTKKLLRLLRRLRRKAGRVRDLDVQMALLRGLKIARQGAQKAQLIRALGSDRGKREKKLVGSLDKNAVRELRKRLKNACVGLAIPNGMEPLALALSRFAEVARDHSPLTQKTVHEYRIVGKRARYLIELAEKDPESEAVVKELKRMQDVVGNWHDWLTLTERAEELFGGVKDSALVAALRNLTRAKFRESIDCVVRTRTLISGERMGFRPVQRKVPAKASYGSNATAA